MAAFWFVSGAAYFAIVYEIWLGSASKLAAAGGESKKHTKFLCWFVLVGWAIYPLGYMMGTTGWYNGIVPAGNIDVTTTLQMLSTKLVSD
jgi:bacteriorhodopsin